MAHDHLSAVPADVHTRVFACLKYEDANALRTSKKVWRRYIDDACAQSNDDACAQRRKRWASERDTFFLRQMVPSPLWSQLQRRGGVNVNDAGRVCCLFLAATFKIHDNAIILEFIGELTQLEKIDLRYNQFIGARSQPSAYA